MSNHYPEIDKLIAESIDRLDFRTTCKSKSSYVCGSLWSTEYDLTMEVPCVKRPIVITNCQIVIDGYKDDRFVLTKPSALKVYMKGNWFNQPTHFETDKLFPDASDPVFLAVKDILSKQYYHELQATNLKIFDENRALDHKVATNIREQMENQNNDIEDIYPL